MEKSILALGLCLFAFAANACRLETPINLSDLNLDEKYEYLRNISTEPKLKEVMTPSQDANYSLPPVLILGYPQTQMNWPYITMESKVLGASVHLGDTVFSIGTAAIYNNITLERKILKSETGENHLVRVFDEIIAGTEDSPVIRDVSMVRIEDNKIVSIEIVHTIEKWNTTSNRYDLTEKTLCVTSASR